MKIKIKNEIKSKIKIRSGNLLKLLRPDSNLNPNPALNLLPNPNLHPNLNPLFLRLLAISILLLFPLAEGNAQPLKTPDARRVSCYWKFTITCDPGTRNFGLNMLLPQTLEGRQKILSLKHSEKPKKIYQSGLNQYARFVFDRPLETMELTVAVEMELYRFDWSTVTRRGPRETKEDVEPWLAEEILIEKDDPDIQAAARNLVGRNTEETLRKTMDFVTRHMSPGDYDRADHGAAWALKNKRGDCTEYADLFVALCRANRIPARWVEGFLAYAKVPKGATAKHDWAEAYLPEYGWIAFDPFHVQQRGATFTHMKPDYIYMDFQRRNLALGNLHFWSYDYSGGKAAVRSEFVVTQTKAMVPAVPRSPARREGLLVLPRKQAD